MMKINHNPKFDTEKVCQLYSEKDGVPVKYVCTSAITAYASHACDVFYRETPHPEFGNRYFGLFIRNDHMYITNADGIEELTFDMVESNDEFHYSQHRHDFRPVPGKNVSIDGGRAYNRLVGDVSVSVKSFKVKDGEFVNAL